MTYLAALTLFHTAISILAIVAGAAAIIGFFRGYEFGFSTKLFLWTAVITSVTGFFFPFKGVTPGQIVGLIALVILAVVVVAYYRLQASKAWGRTYTAGLVASLYLLVFVGVVQAFQKVSFLNGYAPTGTELPFVVAQGITLLFFVVVGIAATLRYRPHIVRAV